MLAEKGTELGGPRPTKGRCDDRLPHPLARPESEADDPERIAIREALAFGKALYDRRGALGLSVADLARRAEMTADEIECIEEGGTEPTVVLLRRLAAALSPSVTHLTTASVYIRRYACQLCRGLDCLDCMPNGRFCARPRLVVTRHREEEQEISMICMQIPQSCLGYINRLMIQDMLAEPEWADRLGLTPLFTVNMTPYGEIQLNLDRRLNLATDGGPST